MVVALGTISRHDDSAEPRLAGTSVTAVARPTNDATAPSFFAEPHGSGDRPLGRVERGDRGERERHLDIAGVDQRPVEVVLHKSVDRDGQSKDAPGDVCLDMRVTWERVGGKTICEWLRVPVRLEHACRVVRCGPYSCRTGRGRFRSQRCTSARIATRTRR